MNAVGATLRKAAIVIACLDREQADGLLDQMPAEQAALMRRMLVEVGDVADSERNRVLAEFCGAPARASHIALSGIELDVDLDRGLGRQAPDPLTATPARFRFLQAAETEEIGPFLAQEHPQTIALIVSHLPSQRAATVIADLPPGLQADVIRRLTDLDEASPDILREVEQGLESRMGDQQRSARRREVGLAAVGNMLRAAQSGTRKRIIENLASLDRTLARDLDCDSLDFADLESLPQTELAELCAAADGEVLRLALAAAAPGLLARALACFSPREARQIKRGLDRLGPTRLSDVEQAQKQIARLANDLLADRRMVPCAATPLLAA